MKSTTPLDSADFVGIATAARRLGISDRQAYRLAATLTDEDKRQEGRQTFVRFAAMQALRGPESAAVTVATAGTDGRHEADIPPPMADTASAPVAAMADAPGAASVATADALRADLERARDDAMRAWAEVERERTERRADVERWAEALKREQETARAALAELREERLRLPVLLAAATSGRLPLSNVADTKADTAPGMADITDPMADTRASMADAGTAPETSSGDTERAASGSGDTSETPAPSPGQMRGSGGTSGGATGDNSEGQTENKADLSDRSITHAGEARPGTDADSGQLHKIAQENGGLGDRLPQTPPEKGVTGGVWEAEAAPSEGTGSGGGGANVSREIFAGQTRRPWWQIWKRG